MNWKSGVKGMSQYCTYKPGGKTGNDNVTIFIAALKTGFPNQIVND